MIALAGPLAEAGAGSLIVLLAVRTHLVFLIFVGAAGVFDALANLVPRERHGFRSDGGYLIDALRSAREQRPSVRPSAHVEHFTQLLADAHSRWVVLFSDEQNAIRTDERSNLLAGAPRALGYSNIADPVAHATWWLAFAGWCWRDVERGDSTRIRDAALDALHASRIEGLLEPELSICAAHTLASGATPLGLASPGTDADESIRFLASAFWTLPAELRPAAVPEEQLKSAFRYGVALRDIERTRE
jgi:hypothetical protein